MDIPKAFLNEEVRCGFMVPTQIKQFWAAELEVLGEIDRICTKHKIKYFADWGTLLGAVRHAGFVPWDDDLDIVMKREDYQKFLRVAKTEMQDGFCVQTYMDMKPGEWLFMGKVMSNSHACFEPQYMRRFHNFPFIACVDVFVLDYVYDDEEKENRRRELCKYLLGLTEAIVGGKIKGNQIDSTLESIEQKWSIKLEKKNDPIEMGRYIYSIIEEQFSASSETESKYLCQLFPWGLKGTAHLYPKRLYETALRLPFEYTTIPVPLDFDRMLRERYGNYFVFDISGGAHDYPCFETQKKNFYDSLGMKEKRYEFDESELRIRENVGEHKETFKEIVKECISSIGVPKSVDEIIEYQQAAIELGNMIESIKGDECKVISSIENYCESLYKMYEACSGGYVCLSEVKNSFSELESCINDEILNKQTVILMPSASGHWKRLKEVYFSLTQEQANEVIVWPMERYYKDYDGTLTELIEDEYNFTCDIHVIGKEKSIDLLGFLHPDIIYFTDGYDQWRENISVDPLYYSDRLIGCTNKLVYVCPYELKDFGRENERAYRNMDYYVTVSGVVRADEVVVSSDCLREMFIKRLDEFMAGTQRGVWEGKVNVCNISKKANEMSKKRKENVLYCVNLGNIVEHGNDAVKKIENSIMTILGMERINLTICTFPDISEESFRLDRGTFDNINVVLSKNNIAIETNIDVDKMDAYYGDASKYIADFTSQNKPVMIQSYF